MVRDGSMPGGRITIFEASALAGGSLDDEVDPNKGVLATWRTHAHDGRLRMHKGSVGAIASLGCAASRPSWIDVLSGTLQDPVAFDPPEESVDVADTTRPWD